MKVDIAQFLQMFFEESLEGVNTIEVGLWSLDVAAVDAETINDIFRAAHSIKGGSATFGFTNIVDFTHLLETLFDEMREGSREVAEDTIGVLLRSVDVLREMLAAARDGVTPDEQRVKAQYDELQRVSVERQNSEALAQGEPKVPISDADSQPIGWRIDFRPYRRLMRTDVDPSRIISELASLASLDAECDLSALPNLENFEPSDCALSWHLRMHEPVDRAAIERVLESVEGVCRYRIMPIMPEGMDRRAQQNAETGRGAAPAPSDVPKRQSNLHAASYPVDRRSGVDRRAHDDRRGSARADYGESRSIRVEIQKLESLIDIVNQLAITQTTLGLINDDGQKSCGERLDAGMVQLEHQTRELQASIMRIRMVPFSFTFGRLQRLVHDLCGKMGKRVELEMSGDSTEVDRLVIETIGNPLVHLLRNSLDHGIEAPEERRAAGKPTIGTVRLAASHRDGDIVIEVRDDGRGLPRDKILNKALACGLVSEADSPSDKELYDLVFQPGFSTADQVSEVSGRGVGMDIVRRNVGELGGRVEIESTPGRGTAISIRIPLTLTTFDGQTARIGRRYFVVPLNSILEIVRIDGNVLHDAEVGEVCRLRDELVPVVRMRDLLGIDWREGRERSGGKLIVLDNDGRKFGLLVDDVLDRQRVTVKPLHADQRRIEGISGATILDDGSLALILDTSSLMRPAGRSRNRQASSIAMSA